MRYILLNIGAVIFCLLIAWFDFVHHSPIFGTMMVMVAMVNFTVVVHLFRRGFHKR